MAKRISEKAWVLAEDLFMAGKSLSQITDETGIKKSSLSERAKKYNWVKGRHEPLVKKAVDLEKQTEQLTEKQKKIYNSDVEALAKHTIRTNSISETAQILMIRRMSIEKDNMPINDIKTIIEANDKASITLGVNPRHANAPQINNTNAQQNNEPVTIQIIKAEELSI